MNPEEQAAALERVGARVRSEWGYIDVGHLSAAEDWSDVAEMFLRAFEAEGFQVERTRPSPS